MPTADREKLGSTETLARLRSLEAEEALVGAVLLSVKNECLDVAMAAGVEPGHLTDRRLARIYEAALSVADGGRVVDLVTVMGELVGAGAIDAIGDAYLLRLIDPDKCPVAANVGHYASIVLERARARTLHQALEVARRGLQGGDTPATVAVGLADALDASLAVRDEEAGQVGELLRRDVGLAKAETIPWGFPLFDRRTGGIPEASLIVIAGYPGEGKTSLTTCVLSYLAAHGTPVALFSVEMSAGQVMQTLLGRESGIGAGKLRVHGAKGLDIPGMAKLQGAVEKMQKWPLHIVAGSVSAEAVCARARVMQRKHGLKLVAVDYLQLLQRAGAEESRRLGIDAAVNSFKALAQSSGLAVLLLSQLARTDAKNPQAKSNLLKESGGINEAADMVVTLDRPNFRKVGPCPECGSFARPACVQCYGDGQVSIDTEIVLNVEKNRLGDTGRVTLGWSGRFMRVYERA